MEVIGIITIITILAAYYVVPAFAFSLLTILAYATTARKIKSFREGVKKAAKLTLVFSVVLFLGQYALIFISKPHTIALEDVSVNNFRLSSYYASAPSLQKALEKIFPPGTPKDYVDKILIEREGAEFVGGTNQSKITGIRYRHRAWPWTCYPMGGVPTVSAYAEYDADLKLVTCIARQMPNGCSHF
jgi:hypothetical protein